MEKKLLLSRFWLHAICIRTLYELRNELRNVLDKPGLTLESPKQRD